MLMSDLHKVTTALVGHGIDAVQVTITGKESQTVSFTLGFKQMEKFNELCLSKGWTFRVTGDQFLARGLGRVQLELNNTEQL